MKHFLFPILLTFTLLMAGCAVMQSHDGSTDAATTGVADITETADGGEEMPVVGISDKTVGVITPIACPVHPDGDEVEGETYSCGTFTVPLDYSDPAGNALDMTFMVLKNTGGNPQADPLVQLVGGPGQSGLIAGGLGHGYDQVREQRDLVFMSVRGTKLAQRIGVEQCLGTAISQGIAEEKIEAIVESISESINEPIDAETDFEGALAQRQEQARQLNTFCQDVFHKAGLDVRHFTTANTATDVVGLVDALGYERYNLHGTSYGTRLALAIMRDHGDSGLRSVVLDSTAPYHAEASQLIRDVRRPHDQVRRLFADCAADPICADAYPDLEQRFIALLASMETAPLQIDGKTIGADELVAVISDLSATRPNYMPQMIADLEQGVTETFSGLQTQQLGLEPPEPQESVIDPALQAFLTNMMMSYAAQGDEETDIFGFMADDVGAAASQDDPRAGIIQLVEDNFEGDVLQGLLAQLNGITDDALAELAAGLEATASDVEVDEEALAADMLLHSQSDSYLLRHVVDCHEEVPFESLDDALAEYGRLEIPQLGGAKSDLIQAVANCTGWDLAEVDPVDNEPVVSDIPTLILQGEFDMATPLGWGQLAVESLEQGTLAFVPLQGHEVWTRENPCVNTIATAFLTDPTQAPDLSCLADRKARFVLPDSVEGEMEDFDDIADMPVYPIPEPAYDSKLVRDFTPFLEAMDDFRNARAAEMDELLTGTTILDIQEMIDAGQFDSVELVTYYLARIRQYDVDVLNSVMELNPEALEIAANLDEERAAGNVRGAMHGIPVLLKANIATGDQMKTTAGAVAMQDWQPARDAFLVQQLRDAGAIILGKANLSEWANYMDPNLPDGFSALGGQTRDAYGPFDPAGSSTGSAVSVAANLTTVSVGTETQGSIIAPSSVNGVAGLKTSRGLVSRDYIIPLMDWMDVPGPIGRSVTDVAVLLTAMTGTDENDPATADAAELAGVDFTQFLSLEQAQEIRVGVAGMSETVFQQIVDDTEKQVGRALTPEEADAIRTEFVDAVGDPQAMAAVLNAQGIETVFIDSSVSPVAGTDPFTPLEYGFQDSFDRFMVSLGENAPLSSLADVAAFNSEDLANRAPYGQAYVEGSVNTAITAEAYAAMKEENMQSSAAALRGLFEEYDVDIIAFRVYTQEYAPAGFPALAIPDGLAANGQPVSVILVGDYLSEPQLLSVGYAYEQEAQGRVEPDMNSRMQELAPVAP